MATFSDGFTPLQLDADKKVLMIREFKDIFNDDLLKPHNEHLLSLQVDLERARQIFKIIAADRSQSSMKARQTIDSLLDCAALAYRCVRNFTTPAKGKETSGLFNRLSTWIESDLKIDVFDLMKDGRNVQYASSSGGRSATHKRDCLGLGDSFSGSLCTLTKVPHAEMAHLIPVNTAGLLPQRLWFWLWTAIVLPKQLYRLLWDSCGGKNNNSLPNTMMLAQTLHRYHDDLSIAFKPVDRTDTTSLALDLVLEAADPHRTEFFNLYQTNGRPIEHGTVFTYRPSSWVRRLERFELPSPFLFSLRRYFVRARGLLSTQIQEAAAPMTCGALDENENPEDQSRLKAWDELQGFLRESTRNSPAVSPRPQSSTGKKGQKRALSPSPLAGPSKRPRDRSTSPLSAYPSELGEGALDGSASVKANHQDERPVRPVIVGGRIIFWAYADAPIPESEWEDPCPNGVEDEGSITGSE